MAFELEYRYTFLNAKEEVEESPGRARARSAPPGRTQARQEPEIEPEDRPFKGRELAPELQQLVPTWGSLGHPETCRRPCIYFISGHCANGRSCTYGHMAHVERMPKLDKKQRMMVRQCSQAQLLSLLVPLCYDRAERCGFLKEAAEILKLMEESSSAMQLPESFPSREFRNLRKALRKMNFVSLVGVLITHQSNRPDDNLATQLVESMDILREQLTV
ncbi:unnamed protein product [Symbiodinium sp. CCMP2456]|nr:unnamed protein product [Symbiodinium sp. CCMP2456]